MAAISSQLSNRENKVDRGPRRAAFSPTANQYRGSKLIRPIYLRVFDLGPSDQTRSGRSEDVFHAFQLSGTLSSRYQMRYRVSADSAVSATPRSRRERPRVLCGVERARYYYYSYFSLLRPRRAFCRSRLPRPVLPTSVSLPQNSCSPRRYPHVLLARVVISVIFALVSLRHLQHRDGHAYLTLYPFFFFPTPLRPTACEQAQARRPAPQGLQAQGAEELQGQVDDGHFEEGHQTQQPKKETSPCDPAV